MSAEIPIHTAQTQVCTPHLPSLFTSPFNVADLRTDYAKFVTSLTAPFCYEKLKCLVTIQYLSVVLIVRGFSCSWEFQQALRREVFLHKIPQHILLFLYY